ncbi:MAG: PH domain-containing protein [Pseudonocardia sp.]
MALIPHGGRAPVSGAAWSPSAGLVTLAGAGAAGSAVWLAVLVARDATDPAAYLFAVLCTGGLGLVAAFGIRARPRLRADADGLTVGGLLRRRHHPWPLVRDVRVSRTRRLGRETSLLEIDSVDAAGTERLTVFGRLDLDADPEDVLAVLTAHHPHRPY